MALAKKDKTQADMAQVIGVTPATLSLIINRDVVPSDRIEQMAHAFDMKVSEFIELGED